MERLTYDFCIGSNHCWQIKGADNFMCKEVCIKQGDDGCTNCPIKKAVDRLAAYEDTGLTPEEIIELKHTWRAATKAFGFNNIPGEGGNDEAD